MRFIALAAITTVAAAFSGLSPARAESAPVITGPVTHGYLAIYFIHGEGAPGPVPLTLQEGMAKDSLRQAGGWCDGGVPSGHRESGALHRM